MNIYENFPLKDILYYKIGGNAKLVLSIENKEDLIKSLDFVSKNNVQKILPIGLGSNLLIPDEFFEGAILWFKKPQKSSISKSSESTVEAFSGDLLDDVIQFSFENNLIGLEWAGGLPSTVGGAIRGNVGAFGEEIKDVVNAVQIITLPALRRGKLDGKYEIKKLTREELKFEYRDSIIKRDKNLVVISVEFNLQHGTDEEIGKAKEIYKSRIEYRQKNHPMEYPSCGSVFKNITSSEEVQEIINKWSDIKELSEQKWHGKIAMGYIINRLGFSGKQIGGAKVSEKHANYIVNVNDAKFSDVFSLINQIKEKFSNEFGFSPELELEVVN